MSLLNWLTKFNSNANNSTSDLPSQEETPAKKSKMSFCNDGEDKTCTNLISGDINSLSESDDHASHNVIDGDSKYFDFPSVWTNEMYSKFYAKYPWLVVKNQKLGCSVCKNIQNLATYKAQGIRFAIEWVECNVNTYGVTVKDKRQSLRKKIHKHKNSECHKRCEEIFQVQEKNILQTAVSKGISVQFESTVRVFNTVYNIIKKTRPFTDLPYDIELQKSNGLDMGRILHSDHACADISSHIATEMRAKITQFLIQNNSKISILIDEATSVSKKTCLVHKFSHEYLINNFICFACDGASNMIGRKAGVAKLLNDKYPNLLIWHCSNHRLELAVDDVLNEVTGINHFKLFFDSLYSFYNASPKNQYGLRKCAKELDLQFLSIGRILNTRWVASSLRSVNAVWRNYEALCLHFEECSKDNSRTSKEKAIFNGLLFDALTELSDLSLELQKRCLKLPEAHNLIRRQILIFESMSENCYDGYYKKAEEYNCSLTFKINERESIRGFREYVDNKSIIPNNLKPLIVAVNSLVVSTAECERLFSAMNIIHNDARNSLKVSRSWILKGRRSADHTQCVSKQPISFNTEYESLWEKM
ncbi:E3 SUMO-protein ligase KIAA1586-like [Aphis gossypii]|uniref:E3 SUMO-protein ligase KIAA1586-like n=1 Tax=Aphis gossypii TaxID=80765 RepID=UPI0021596DA5|nr:E3 SUMO-protein ligase KIAA1586-like [Aphis gossypii]